MATANSRNIPELTVLEYNFIKQGLILMRSSIGRSVAKETNVDIVRLKNVDIASINSLITKLDTM